MNAASSHPAPKSPSCKSILQPGFESVNKRGTVPELSKMCGHFRSNQDSVKMAAGALELFVLLHQVGRDDTRGARRREEHPCTLYAGQPPHHLGLFQANRSLTFTWTAP